MRAKLTHALPDPRDLRTSSNCCYQSPPSIRPWNQKKWRRWGRECGWIQPKYMHSVSFSGKFASGSRIRKTVVRYLQFGVCWVNNQEHLSLIPLKTIRVAVFYQRKVNGEMTDRTRDLAIEDDELWLQFILQIQWMQLHSESTLSTTFGFPYLRVCWIFVRYSSSHARVLMARIPETTWFIKEMRLSDIAAVRKRSAALR